MTSAPRFAHPPCDSCTYLGQFEDCDLYHCTQGGRQPTLIARYGGEPMAYTSGLEFAKPYRGMNQALCPPIPALAHALTLAKARNLPLTRTTSVESLLRAALWLCNEVPNRPMPAELGFKDSYALAAALTQHHPR